LDAVYHAQPNDEQTWLEWKSTLDLRSKEHMATIVSKTIIAMANRDPDEAAVTVGGIGILPIGIEPGSVQGVTAVDNADLDQMISLYVATDGPIWQPHWDQYQGKTVLIIEVSPPQWGDPPHAFRKAFDPISDGQVYVRKKARSVPPDHKDVLRLADRYATGPRDDGLDVTVVIDAPSQLPRFTWTEENVQSFVDDERRRLLEPLQEQRAHNASAERISRAAGSSLGTFDLLQFSTLPAMAMPVPGQIVPESRSEKAYEAQVADYLKRVQAAWPTAMKAAAARLVLPLVIKVTNQTDRNYHRLQVKLRLTGSAGATEVFSARLNRAHSA